MADEWFYARDGQQAGPAPLDQIRRWATAGQLYPSDLVWTEGMDDWAAAGDVPGIFPPAKPHRRPQPPPIPAQAAPPPDRDPYFEAPAQAHGARIDIAMLSALDTLVEDALIFRWAGQQLAGDESKLQLFQRTYLEKKKDKGTAHALNLIAIFGLGGIHRFYLGDVALGVGMLLTCGFCWVGTLVDLFAIEKRVNSANVRVAMRTLQIVQLM